MKKRFAALLLPLLVCSAHAATITVNSPVDGVGIDTNTCTLRDAVAAINNGSIAGSTGCSNALLGGSFGTNDTIVFDPSLGGGTIPVAVPDATGEDRNPGGGIEITKSLIIKGPSLDANGNPRITLDGGGTNRIFYVPYDGAGGNAYDNNSLEITGVAFTRGFAEGLSYDSSWVDYGGGGGAILVLHIKEFKLTLEHCAFEGNIADAIVPGEDGEPDAGAANTGGGAVAVYTPYESGSTITIRNSTFSNNEAKNDSLDSVGGGAVYLLGVPTAITISNSTFSNNKAVGSGGAVFVMGPWQDSSILSAPITIRNSTFDHNKASGDGTVNIFGGGAVAINAADTIISNSTFSNNEAEGCGGAVLNTSWSHPGYSIAAISNSTFSNNGVTVGYSASSISYDGYGGAVCVKAPAKVHTQARHLTLLGNTAQRDGQALFVDSNVNATATMELHNSIIIGTNDKAQCAKGTHASTTITGSYNLEGYEDGAGNWNDVSGAATCTTSNPVSAGVASLGEIIESTPGYHGGPTQTLKLPDNSPAIGAVDSSGVTSQMWDFTTDGWTDATEDQRGSARPTAPGERSIGAYEGARAAPSPSGGATPIPTLPVPLLLGLMALVGTAASARQRRR